MDSGMGEMTLKAIESFAVKTLLSARQRIVLRRRRLGGEDDVIKENVQHHISEEEEHIFRDAAEDEQQRTLGLGSNEAARRARSDGGTLSGRARYRHLSFGRDIPGETVKSLIPYSPRTEDAYTADS